MPHMFHGVEFGRFRLKPGATEAELIGLGKAMEERYLKNQPGFVAHFIVALDDGVYMDVVHAETRQDAERICASWMGQPDCEAFLSLIEADSISFGRVLSSSMPDA